MTPNKEDYLKAIYKLGGQEKQVGNKRIAEALKIAPASVTEMLGKLRAEGLILYEAYKGSMLTPQGLRIAIGLVRGHRLWEVFLMRHLNYSWSEAHEDAERLEHISPKRMIERLNVFLNYPAYCPHGSSIPDADGRVDAILLIPLNRMSAGDSSHIRRVTEEAELLDYLQRLGLSIGQGFYLESFGEYEGPLTLLLDGRRVQISYKAAGQIYAEEPTVPV